MQQQRNQRDNTARVLTRGLLLFFFLGVTPFAHASQETGSIDGTLKYAFSNVGGWVNFAPAQSRVTVTNTALTGYAWSANDGWINLAPAQGGVKNTTSGNLSGFAWDQAAGWVNFAGVTIDASGRFHGQATGANGYVINFDCSSCNVTTSWRYVPTVTISPGSISPIYIPPTTQTVSNTPPAPEPPTNQRPPQPQPPSDTSGGTSPIPSSGGVVQQGGKAGTTTQVVANKPALQTATKPKVATSTTPATKQSFWSSMTFRVVGGVSVLALLGLVWWVFL